ncbi:SDR family NAD(P)-dependent oxidoreductase [Yangia mangrovi]|uniref:SDR family NAD(P)-dependent oxidoreductase n=1 Tax=Alloyangia mangrovi TaxID=1779329 RepID=A0ABT2KPV0_9RHOB|nr:SDR family NAD(P)-dependent oxidoreductase [Alloyangia mangrovi]MCT4372879.1 SDR family NAD(P)-dependent oxidoreductase [Alloyangia mangrovi]
MPTVLIIGAQAGAGLALAHAYARRGWAVLAANPRPFAAADFARLGPEVSEFRYDPTSDASARDIAQRLTGRAIDLAIFTQVLREETAAPIDRVTGGAFERTMLENTFAPLHLAALLAPNLAAADQPVAVALVDPAGRTGRFHGPAQYGLRASQAALVQMWRNLAVEWQESGIRCLALQGAGEGVALAEAVLRAIDTADETPSGSIVDLSAVPALT